MSLLLRHGADTELCNSLEQRPIDVATNDDVIDLLSNSSTHLADDSDVDGDHPATAADTDRHADRHHPVTDDDTVLKKAGCDDPADDMEHCEPIDLSVRAGVW